MLAGLYLITPLLRILVAHASAKIIRYLAALWFVGASVIPVFHLVTPYTVDSNLLLVTGYVGYYVLGLYLLGAKVKRGFLLAAMIIGFVLTSIGTYFIAGSVGGGQTYFFQEYLSPTIILSAMALFLLLTSIPFKPQAQVDGVGRLKWTTKFLHLVSENTLPMFLFHMIIIEAFQKGFFGVTLNGNTVNSIIGIPIVTALTFFVSLAIIVPLKRVPILRTLLG